MNQLPRDGDHGEGDMGMLGMKGILSWIISRIPTIPLSPSLAYYWFLGFVLSIVFCTALLGAPPTIKYLHPAGSQRGATIDVTAKGDFSTWPVQCWTADPSVKVECSDEKGKLKVTIDEAVQPGIQLIRLYDDEGASKPIPFVVGNLPEVLESSSNDSPDKAERLSAPMVTINGRLEKRDDVDVYAVELDRGQTLVASVVANELVASPMDGVLQVLAAGGAVLAQNDDWHGLDPQIVFTAPSAGTYKVRIFAFPAQPDSRIGLAGGEDYLYRLTVTTGPFVDYAWPLAVKNQETTEVELIGWNLAEPMKRQSVQACGSRPRSAEEHPFALTGETLAGQLSLAVEPHACLVEVEPNGSDGPQSLELPATISGRLSAAADRDVYRFSASRGESFIFQLNGRRLGSPLDAVLEITDAAGKSLAKSDDVQQRRDPELTWKSPDDGRYQVIVADLHGHGDERFFYRLRVMRAKPDFQVTSGEHAWVGTVGKPLEITLDIDRQHDLGGEVNIRVDGLPESISAEPVTSAKSGDSAKKVKLTVTATAAYSGPFRIIAATQAEHPIERLATYKVSDAAETSDLWLTFKAAKQE